MQSGNQALAEYGDEPRGESRGVTERWLSGPHSSCCLLAGRRRLWSKTPPSPGVGPLVGTYYAGQSLCCTCLRPSGSGITNGRFVKIASNQVGIPPATLETASDVAHVFGDNYLVPSDSGRASVHSSSNACHVDWGSMTTPPVPGGVRRVHPAPSGHLQKQPSD